MNENFVRDERDVSMETGLAYDAEKLSIVYRENEDFCFVTRETVTNNSVNGTTSIMTGFWTTVLTLVRLEGGGGGGAHCASAIGFYLNVPKLFGVG